MVRATLTQNPLPLHQHGMALEGELRHARPALPAIPLPFVSFLVAVLRQVAAPLSVPRS